MPQSQTYIVNLKTLQEGDYQYNYLLDDAFFAEIGENEILGGNVRAVVDLAVREQGCKLHLQAQGEVKITCDRCLDEMSQEVEANETLLVKLAVADDEIDDEAIYVDPKSGELDLAWLLYEMIEINLPIVHSHQAGECNPQMEELLQTHLCTNLEEPEE